MRTTFDRISGPLAIVQRSPARSLAPYGGAGRRVLVPTDLHKWAITVGRRVDRELYREIAEYATKSDHEILAAARLFGLLTPVPAVDEARANALLLRMRTDFAAGPSAPPSDPLVVYAEGEDPRPLWKTHAFVSMNRDLADEVSDAVIRTLRHSTELCAPDDSLVIARTAAEAWQAGQGIAKLDRAIRSQIPKGANEVLPWVALAHALLLSSTRVEDGRLMWSALGVLLPLLRAAAHQSAIGQDEAAPDWYVEETVEAWRALAVEAEAWLEMIGELQRMRRLRSGPGSASAATKTVKLKAEKLRSVLPSQIGDLRHRLHDLEASDIDGITLRLRTVVGERLVMAGVPPDAPFGSLIGAEAAVLLSVRSALGTGSCCGFRSNPITHFGPIRSPVSDESDQPFRSFRNALTEALTTTA